MKSDNRDSFIQAYTAEERSTKGVGGSKPCPSFTGETIFPVSHHSSVRSLHRKHAIPTHVAHQRQGFFPPTSVAASLHHHHEGALGKVHARGSHVVQHPESSLP